MKSQLAKYKLLMLLIIIVGKTYAGNLVELKKSVNKSFAINKSTQISISNQFGDITVKNWEKNELKVTVEISVNGRNEQRAKSMLDDITIDIDESSSGIALETVLSGHVQNKSDESIEINYSVYMPAGSDIYLENKFGDTFVADRKGVSKFQISYGNLKAENMEGPVELELSFGNGSIGQMKSAKAEVKYSDLQIETVDELELEQHFSNVTLGSVINMELESKYGEVNVEKLVSANCDVQFSGFQIDELVKSLVLEANYVSEFKINKLKKDFELLKCYGKFSSLNVTVEPGLKADLDAEFSFADMTSQLSDMNLYYKAKEDHRSEYKAKIGGGNPSKKIIIKSSYGGLKLK